MGLAERRGYPIAAGRGQAPPGRARPPWARRVRTTAGSCTMATTRSRPPDLVGTLHLVERDADGRLVVVDLKTAARKYSDLQVEASLQLSIYSYAVDPFHRAAGWDHLGQSRSSSPRASVE